MEKQKWKQSLQDCGMEQKNVNQFLKCEKEKDQLRLLHQQRKRLMDNLHQAQRKVDVVDYVIHQIEKEKEK